MIFKKKKKKGLPYYTKLYVYIIKTRKISFHLAKILHSFYFEMHNRNTNTAPDLHPQTKRSTLRNLLEISNAVLLHEILMTRIKSKVVR